ncbi:MAG: phosphodiesterase [Steroidobacteraceae bacterium]
MKTLLALTLALCVTPLSAETLLVDDQVQIKPASVQLPARGSSMATVEARFGAPRERHAAVGKPPITRWDYDGFSVYFEYQHVIHAVAHSS